MAGNAETSHHANWAMGEGITPTSGQQAARSRINVLANLPVYNILNGDGSNIVPYVIRATMPEYAKWVPVAGMRHAKAMECVDAFIRSHIYHVEVNGGDEFAGGRARKAGIVLGVCRAVMYANYEISRARLVAGETVAPVMAAVFTDGAAPRIDYRCLAEDPRPEEMRVAVPAGPDGQGGRPAVADPRTVLLEDFALSDLEQNVVSVLSRTAQAILPLQGYSLITEGHHYLSDPSKNSYKACLAVEKQHWTTKDVQEWFDDSAMNLKDLIWHKAGHPVQLNIKEFAATSEQVAQNLVKADLGGAAVRLPAVESEAKAIGSYLRVTNEVRASFESRGGTLDNAVLGELQRALAHFPRARLTDVPNMQDPAPVVVGAVLNERGEPVGGTTLRSRAEVLSHAREVISRNSSVVATCFGYYVAMSEAVSMTATVGAGRGGGDSLVRAYSLRKLQSEHMTAYSEGMEYFRDHQAARAKARREGRVEAPTLVIS